MGIFRARRVVAVVAVGVVVVVVAAAAAAARNPRILKVWSLRYPSLSRV